MLYLPKRRNLKNFKRKSICRFPSVKGDVPVVRTEGVLEKDFCYHLEFDPLVLQYQCQPIGYYYYLNNEKLGYTPDFDTHNNIFWVAALVLAVVELPDFLTPLKSIAKSLATIAQSKEQKTPEKTEETVVVKEHI